MEEGVKIRNASSTVVLALSGTKDGRHLVQWALNKFVSAGEVQFTLLHVRATMKLVPTPLGRYIPIHQVRDGIEAAYKKEVEWKTKMMLQPYKRMCEKLVETEIMLLEADDIAEAIAKVVIQNAITRLVIGSSSSKSFIGKHKDRNLTSRISGCMPSFCEVYIVAKDKSEKDDNARTMKTDENIQCEGGDPSFSYGSLSKDFSSLISAIKIPLSRLPNWQSAFHSHDHRRSASTEALETCAPFQPTQPKAIYRHDHRRSTSDPLATAIMSSSTEEDSSSSQSSFSESSMISSDRSFQSDNKSGGSLALTVFHSEEFSTSENEHEISLELQRLMIELGHLKNMHKDANDTKISNSKQLNDLHQHHIEEIEKLEEIISGLNATNELVEQEKIRNEIVGEEGLCVKNYPEKDVASDDSQIKEFTWEEILGATSSFSDHLKLGIGANGTVYKGYIDQSVIAVKLLHSTEGDIVQQFKQELEVLSNVRHPHLLMLIGVCSGKGCLVYEYMESGSLDDRLECKDNTPPLPWFCRIRIAWEVASALAFLHDAKPKPIIHRDLKPANILLDKDCRSKIGDVGVSILLPSADNMLATVNKDSSLVGTFLYMDPEYQRTGLLSPKQDIYALGLLILQLLTAKSPMGLAFSVETALENGCLGDILDPQAGQWPLDYANEMAILGLRCSEMRRKDRPDLNSEILPILDRLRNVVDKDGK